MHKSLLLLIISLMAAILPASAAEEFTVGGLDYTPNNDNNTASVTGFNASIISGDLVIPSTVSNEGVEYTVTSIGEQAFGEYKALTSVTIPEGVTLIDGAAFKDCSNLASVTIPESMTSIGNSAFEGCFSLVSVTIPDNVTTIGNNAFAVCESLTSVRIGKGVTSMGGSAFYGCISLVSVTIPDNVATIGMNAFARCYALTSVRIGKGAISIGENVFDLCRQLNKVVFTGDISENLTSYTFTGIAAEAQFYVPKGTEEAYAIALGKPVDEILGYVDASDYDYLTFTQIEDTNDCEVTKGTGEMPADLEIPDMVLLTDDNGVTDVYTVTQIVDYAFGNCRGLQSVMIPESVTSIGMCAFLWCEKMTSVTIPHSVIFIGEGAFRACLSLASVTIPDDVTTIGNKAFADCFALTSVKIGNGVTSIGKNVFDLCRHLDKVVFTDDISGILLPEVFYGIADEAKFYVPKGTEEVYAAKLCEGAAVLGYVDASDYGYLTFTTIVGTNDCEVAKGTDDMPADLKIPDLVLLADDVYPVIQLADFAFKGCTSLVSVTIPESITSIGDFAFKGCTSLVSATIPESVISIGDYAFQDCKVLASINIPASVTSIGDGTFYGCESLASVTIPTGVTQIGDEAFYDCTSLVSVTIPLSVTQIGDRSFESCTSLGSVTIPASVTSIGNAAFQGCTSLGSVTIPESVTSIDGHTFTDCTSLGSVTIPESVTSIGDFAFAGCTNLGSVTIPESVTSIDDFTFAYCSSLASVMIPSKVTSIHEYAFHGCTGLASIVIPASVTEIAGTAFDGCEKLAQAVMLNETPLSNITEIGLRTEATVYVANAEAVLAYAGKLSGKVAAIKPILAVTAEPEKEYYKVSKPMDAPDVAMASVYQPETVWSAEPLADGTANGDVEEDGKLVVTGHGDVTFRVSDANNPQVYATFTVRGYLLGDANYDGRVTVTDAANVASHIVDLDVTGYFELGADANEDKSVDIADVTTIVYIVLDTDYAGGIQPGGNSRAGSVVEALVRPGAVDVAPDGIACGELTAVQADVVLAPGARVRGVVRGDCLSESHNIAWREHDGGRVRVIVYSLAAAALRDGSSLFTIEVDGEAGVTTVDNIFASTTGGEETVLGYGGHVTGITVPVADDEPGTLYNLGGRVVARGIRISEIPSETPRGVYIFRNSKGATKLMHE